MDEVVAYADGGSRGNPGPAAAAFILTDRAGNTLCAKGFFLGRTTNNVAEYTAVCKALEHARQLGAQRIRIFSDSELLVRQLTGRYRVKSPSLRPLFETALRLLNQMQHYQLEHVGRQANAKADRLVNQVLDLQHDVDASPAGDSSTPTAKSKKPLRLGILISGGGRTMLNILEHIKQGRLNAEIAVVISSRSTVAGVERARASGLNVKIIRKKDFAGIDEFSSRIEQELVAAGVELVVQAGWLCLWKIPPRYRNRVMNIHPALLPSFGGQGMWGHHVHEAVLAAGCKVSGCTVHFCTNEYDKGPIIVQRCCPVREDDTADTLAARVFEQECIAYPEAIRLFEQGRISVRRGRTVIK